ncbi:MAG: threonine--tRNA ligase [archaeon]
MKDTIRLRFKDGEKEFTKGTKAEEVIKEHFKKEAQKAIAAKLDDKAIDLSAAIEHGGSFEVIINDTPEGLDILRHSSSHLMALAIKRLYPGVKVTIGPSIEDGFYYDFDNLKISEDDFKKIEDEMDNIIHEKLPFARREVSKAEALKFFHDEPYKLELINELPAGEKITTYKLGEFEDLCRGPHIPSSKAIGAIKLMKLAGAYWKGDSKNKMLTRIYGISFPDKKLLTDYLTRLEEAKKRDHRKIGQQMDLFSFHDEAPGMPFFHNKGSFIWNTLVNYTTELMLKRNYQINKTPMILNKSLWLQSGHWDHYKDNMYFTKIDGNDFAVKPMNCPGNILIYKTTLHSYRELPMKAGEFGLVHRHELSGVLSGLLRVRCFTQDDAHVFCTEEQVEEQTRELIDFMAEMYSTFGFEYHMELSTRPEPAMGDPKLWDLAESKLRKVLDSTGKEYKTNEGDGAFYGPKIDFHLKDALGRTWQCGTIQLDFQMPEKFDLTYEGKDGLRHRPVMLHRTILGSVERFMGILLEHFAGKLPLWISPVQAKILPIAERHFEYANKVADKMRERGLRVEIDERSETTSKKVRDAQMQKVNYILVVGDREEQEGSVNVRTRNGEIRGSKEVDSFIMELLAEAGEKRIS